jgi:hypothetical protein
MPGKGDNFVTKEQNTIAFSRSGSIYQIFQLGPFMLNMSKVLMKILNVKGQQIICKDTNHFKMKTSKCIQKLKNMI